MLLLAVLVTACLLSISRRRAYEVRGRVFMRPGWRRDIRELPSPEGTPSNPPGKERED